MKKQLRSTVKKQSTGVLYAGLIALCLSSTANAELSSRLGGQAVYDTDRNITWLADANAGAGSTFDDGTSPSDGLMTWGSAKAWAASLNVEGVTGWRLATSDTSCNVALCFGSEMGHLFFGELGGTSGTPILSSGDPDLALFSNIQSLYWTDTELPLFPIEAFAFNVDNGLQTTNIKSSNLFAWAVRTGDVGRGGENEANFNESSNELDIPVAFYRGVKYHAILQNTGNFIFSLKSAQPVAGGGANEAVLNEISRELVIPVVNYRGSKYIVVLQHPGNFIFSIKNALPL